MLKRLFDLIASLLFLVLLSPVFLILMIAVLLSSPGGAFYMQERIGKNSVPFKLFKFRTMKVNAEKRGQLTVGERDNRITNVGYFLRKYKLDELPQLFNVLLNQMSIVGPRPEVQRYVSLYNEEQMKVLEVKPGLTDLASLEYIDENRILGQAEDPEKTYIEEIMPKKLSLNLEYIEKQSFLFDLKIIFSTIGKILS